MTLSPDGFTKLNEKIEYQFTQGTDQVAAKTPLTATDIKNKVATFETECNENLKWISRWKNVKKASVVGVAVGGACVIFGGFSAAGAGACALIGLFAAYKKSNQLAKLAYKIAVVDQAIYSLKEQIKQLGEGLEKEHLEASLKKLETLQSTMKEVLWHSTRGYVEKLQGKKERDENAGGITRFSISDSYDSFIRKGKALLEEDTVREEATQRGDEIEVRVGKETKTYKIGGPTTGYGELAKATAKEPGDSIKNTFHQKIAKEAGDQMSADQWRREHQSGGSINPSNVIAIF